MRGIAPRSRLTALVGGCTIGLCAVVLLAPALSGCVSEKKRYIEEVRPMVARFEQVAVETDSIAAAVPDPAGLAGAEAKLAALEERLRKLNVEFTSILPPNEISFSQGNMVKAIASEMTGISALRGFVARSVSAGPLRSRMDDLRARKTTVPGSTGGEK
jgi:hypothetical protein